MNYREKNEPLMPMIFRRGELWALLLALLIVLPSTAHADPTLKLDSFAVAPVATGGANNPDFANFRTQVRVAFHS